MSPEQVERLKREYTDQWVQVTGDRPDHRRFGDAVGQVKTINMNGRALVEFHGLNQDIGWYDIDLDFLKVVDKPAPVEKPAKKAKPKSEAAKPAATTGEAPQKKLSPIEILRQQGAKKEAVEAPAKTEAEPTNKPAKKLSPIEILRQQAGKRGDEAEAAIDNSTESASPSEVPAPKPAAKKLSPIEILRQQAGKRGDEAKAAVQDSQPASQPAETPAPAAQPVEPPVAEPTKAVVIPPEHTPEPLRRAREMEAARGRAQQTGYLSTSDVYEIAKGKKPQGWKPSAEKDEQPSYLRTDGQNGGRVTGEQGLSAALSTAEIYAISQGKQVEAKPAEEAPADETASEETAKDQQPGVEPAASENAKPSTADIIAQLRKSGGK